MGFARFAVIALIALIVVAIVFVYRRDTFRSKSAGYSMPAEERQRTRPDSATSTHAQSSTVDVETGTFQICGRDRYRCVIDGDTFILDGVHVRIADIDAPEIGGAKCEHERTLGLRAKARLTELLNEGPFQLQTVDRDVDRYDRKLRVVTRNGNSLGDDLIKEGLARRCGGRKKPWC